MTKGFGYRPQLLPPHSWRLQRSRRSFVTCFAVTISITTLIFSVFGLTAYNILENRFGHNEYPLHSEDMMSLRISSSDISPVWCQGYKVEPNYWTNIYLVPQTPSLDPSLRANQTFSIIHSFQPQDNKFYSFEVFFLLPGTKVNMVGCRKSSGKPSYVAESSAAEFMVILGQNNFKDWINDYANYHKYVKNRINIDASAHCDKPRSSLPTIKLTLDRAIEAYFVIHVGHPNVEGRRLAEDILLSGSISRVYYNIHDAKEVCSAKQISCIFPFSWGSAADIVVKVLDDPQIPYRSVSAFAKCQPRLAMWIGCFGGIPVLLVMLSAIGCAYVLVIRRSIESRYRLNRGGPPISPTTYGSTSEENLYNVLPSMPHNPVAEDEEGLASIQDKSQEDED